MADGATNGQGAVLSVRAAAARLGTTSYRVRDLIARRVLRATEMHTESGHSRLVVHEDSLTTYLARVEDSPIGTQAAA